MRCVGVVMAVRGVEVVEMGGGEGKVRIEDDGGAQKRASRLIRQRGQVGGPGCISTPRHPEAGPRACVKSCEAAEKIVMACAMTGED